MKKNSAKLIKYKHGLRLSVLIYITFACALTVFFAVNLVFSATGMVCGAISCGFLFIFSDINTAAAVLIIIAYGVLAFTVFYKYCSMRELDKRNQVLKTLLDSVPSGVVRCVNDDDLTVLYHSQGIIRLCGESFDGTRLKSIMFPQDVFEVFESLKSQLAKGDEFELTFRCMRGAETHADGESHPWLLCRGKKVKTAQDKDHLHCVLLDITEAKNIEQRQKIDQERYRIVAEASDSVIFEYYLKDNKVFCTNKFLQKFGSTPPVSPMPDIVLNSGFVHDADEGEFKKFYNCLLQGCEGDSTELRLKKSDGTYIWCELRYSTIFDDCGLPIRAVGKIIDIDKKRREKESLIKANQIDPFTGLYNKVSVLKHIETFLRENNNSCHALFFIDIDNFKGVNDTYGHIYGDKMLLDISQKIKQQARSTDILGRIGGDEFVLLLTHYADISYVREKAESLRKCIKECAVKNEERTITTSIGVALYPDDGDSLNQIYYKADIALYSAKNQGRDRVWFYDNC